MVWMLIGSFLGAVLLAAMATLVFGGGDFDFEHFLMWCGALVLVVILGWFIVAQLRGPAPPAISGAGAAGANVWMMLPISPPLPGGAPW